MKDIETLLNKYFEGETTCEEERRLRRFFAEVNFRGIDFSALGFFAAAAAG